MLTVALLCILSPRPLDAGIAPDSINHIRGLFTRKLDSAIAVQGELKADTLLSLMQQARQIIRLEDSLSLARADAMSALTDSLSAALMMNEKVTALQEKKISRAVNRMYFILGGSGFLLLLCLLTAVLLLRRNAQLQSLRAHTADHERLLLEYRKSMNDMQNDLVNSRNQAQSQITEIKRLEEDITRLKEENRKRLEQFISSWKGTPAEQRIQELEELLMFERSRKKSLEADILHILEQLRGEQSGRIERLTE